ncbi:hypothetical protein ACJX0J_028586, partial [Zea mays]
CNILDRPSIYGDFQEKYFKYPSFDKLHNFHKTSYVLLCVALGLHFLFGLICFMQGVASLIFCIIS